jgi:tRNA modification GTPase
MFPTAEISAICVSAKTGEGLDILHKKIVQEILNLAACGSAVGGSAAGGYVIDTCLTPGTIRQKKLIDAAGSFLEEALMLSEKEEPLDLIAPLLREAVNSLGEITGEVSTADILEEMFNNFCVGK